jgi:hypothetical protein
MDYKSYIAQTTYQISLDSSLCFKGTTNKKLTEYAAYDYKSKINQSNDALKDLKSREEQGAGFEVENMEIKNLESQEAFAMAYDITRADGMSVSGDMIYFSPVIAPFFAENPFKLEKREFPIEFNYPYSVQTVYTYKIPDNYQVTETPEPVAVKLPDNSGTFFYQVQHFGNILNVSSLIQIKRSMFLPDEYENVKTFFQLIIDKQQELIVLKSI